MSEMRGPVFAPEDYAGFFRRTLALVIDLFLLVLVYISASYAWYDFAPEHWITGESDFWIGVGWTTFGLVYMFGFRLTERGTLGYRLVGIRYAYMLLEKPTRVWLVWRSLWAVFLLAFFGLDHLWILFDERKQAWHDKISGFYVVKRNAQPTGVQPIVRRVINFMGYSLMVWEPATADGG